jgi:hypothetical protein
MLVALRADLDITRSDQVAEIVAAHGTTGLY